MFTSLKLSNDHKRAIMVRSHHNRKHTHSKARQGAERSEAVFATKSYRDGLQRAFNKLKEQVYFNPDMDTFITLTYAKADNTVEEVLQDVKLLIKTQKRANERSFPAGSGQKTLKYVYIMEYQKRGSIHVHMIANNSFSLQVNKNGYDELKYWAKGFSSVLHITDFDNNFRPYLYLFKYMKKSQRIGKSFVHASRNLTNYTTNPEIKLNLQQWRTINMEYTETTIQTTNFRFYKNYLQIDDTMQLPLTNQEKLQWLEQVKSHSMKAQEKLQVKHSQL